MFKYKPKRLWSGLSPPDDFSVLEIRKYLKYQVELQKGEKKKHLASKSQPPSFQGATRHQGQAAISQGVKEYTRLPFYMRFQMPH